MKEIFIHELRASLLCLFSRNDEGDHVAALDGGVGDEGDAGLRPQCQDVLWDLIRRPQQSFDPLTVEDEDVCDHRDDHNEQDHRRHPGCYCHGKRRVELRDELTLDTAGQSHRLVEDHILHLHTVPLAHL